MLEAAEPTLICPYNKAHAILSSRMQFHLAKCRIQYPNAEKTVCPFNSTHIINKVELEYHMQACPDRYVLDSFTYKVGTATVPKIEVAKIETIEIRGDENWDDDTPVSVLDTVHETSKTKPTLQALIGAPRSERKAFRNQERLRIQRVLDHKEIESNKSGGRGKKTGIPFSNGNNDEKDVWNKNGKGFKNNLASFIEDEGERFSDCETDNSTTGESKEPRNCWNVNKPFSFQAADSSIQITRPFGNLNIQPMRPATDGNRDPGNPWAKPKTAPTSTAPPYQNDFPMLPVAGRGRGRRIYK